MKHIKSINEYFSIEMSEDNMEFVDGGDGVSYEIWEDKEGTSYRVPIERGSDKEEKKYGEVRIDRFFDQAEKI